MAKTSLRQGSTAGEGAESAPDRAGRTGGFRGRMCAATLTRWGGVGLVCLALLPSAAQADALVNVELRGPDGKPADGTVLLERGEQRHQCQTRAGKCQIAGVSGGLYKVSVQQEGKQAPKPREAMIPPSGEVSLIVRGG